MGRHQKTVSCLFEEDLQQVAGIQTQDGPAVRFDVADRGQFGVETFNRLKIRGKEQIVDLADLAVALVDVADLGGKYEADWNRRRRNSRQGRGDMFVFELKQAGFGRNQVL